MGLTYADITLANGIEYGLAGLGQIPREKVKQMTVRALVVTVSLCSEEGAIY